MAGTTSGGGNGKQSSLPAPGGCGLCGIHEPFDLVEGYEAPIVVDRTPNNKHWGQLGPTRQTILEQLITDGLTAHHHQCCIISLLYGANYCIACAAARAAGRHQRPATATRRTGKTTTGKGKRR